MKKLRELEVKGHVFLTQKLSQLTKARGDEAVGTGTKMIIIVLVGIALWLALQTIVPEIAEAAGEKVKALFDSFTVPSGSGS